MSQEEVREADMPGPSSAAEDATKLELRHEYRTLMFKTKEKRAEYTRPESTGLLETLEEINQLFPKVKGTREAALDSSALRLTSELGREQAHNLQTNMTEFDPAIFAEKLVTFMEGRCRGSRTVELDWLKLGRSAITRFSTTPTLDFIYGPLAMEPIIKNRAARERVVQKKPDASQKKKPKQLLENEQEESTTKEVQRVFKALHNLTNSESGSHTDGVEFFEFIVDPTSFATTVENMFHLSFLVKDGRVRLYLDEDNVPKVKFAPKGNEITSTPSTTRQIKPSQVVLGMTISKWKELIKEFNIERALIPNIKGRAAAS